jgi:hypothetical protein
LNIIFNWDENILGEKLNQYYQKANKLGGLKAKMRMSILTKIPYVRAASSPDTAENIAKFEKALVELEKEFGTKG